MAEDMTRFTKVDEQVDPRIFITFLEAVNALADIQSVKRLMIAQLELRRGLRVLDVGCGIGDDVRDLAGDRVRSCSNTGRGTVKTEARGL